MTRLPGALLVVAVCLLGAAPAAGQIVGHPIEVSGHAGYFKPDDRARTAEGPEFGGTLGLRFMPWLTLEGQATFAPSDADTAPKQKHNFSYVGLDACFNLVPPESRVVPFVLVGLGYGLSHTTGTEGESLDHGAGSLGLGGLWNISNQRTFVRLQVRNIFFRERGPKEFSNHMTVNLGLQYRFGGREKDSDFDGVRDDLDRCPDTPLGARVDASGCPLDGDRDGVFDGLDACPDTKTGCVVDSTGCPIDTDGDGVCDGLDQCADTPAGAAVDSNGCPQDVDGDGVLQGIDQCPDTPKGCVVDAQGCPQDADGDGVCDGIDQCPNTPDSVAVNAFGCPYVLGPVEMQMLEKGRVRINNVSFITARGDLDPAVFPLLRRLGSIIDQYPDLQFELAGFTDDRGDSAAAERMSLSRAAAVHNWFVKNVPAFDAARVDVKGYGAAGSGDAARYVELRVVNRDRIPAELQKRTPPDTTGTGMAPDSSDSGAPRMGDAVPGGGAAPGAAAPDSGTVGSAAAPAPGAGSAGGATPDTTRVPAASDSSAQGPK